MIDSKSIWLSDYDSAQSLFILSLVINIS